MWGAMFAGGRGDRHGNPLGSLVLAILAPIAAAMIQAAISRSREFQADASAAKLIGDGRPLARALERLDVYSQRIPSGVNPSQASNYIIDPLKAQARGQGGGGGFGRMFSTHPPTAERIHRLTSATGSNPHPPSRSHNQERLRMSCVPHLRVIQPGRVDLVGRPQPLPPGTATSAPSPRSNQRGSTPANLCTA